MAPHRVGDGRPDPGGDPRQAEAVARSVKLSGKEQAQGPGIQNFEQLTELSRAGKLSAEDRHVVAIVDWLLQYAFDTRASDIHLEPRRDTGNVRFRIDGILHQVY